MKSRPIIKRSERPVRYESNCGQARYYAYCTGLLPNYYLVTEGSLMAGDYFKESPHSKAWIQALGAIGTPVKIQAVVCRPKK